MANEYCRLCLSSENVINVFSNEVPNSEKLRQYIFKCSGVNILASDIITKCICYTCCETIKNNLKFRNVAITNDLLLKHTFRQENDSDENNVDDLDIEDVFQFLPRLQEEPTENKDNLNILKYDTKVNTVDLDLTQNNMNDLRSMPTQVPEDLNTLETSEMVKGTEMNWDEFNDWIIKEETVVMSNDFVEDIEVGKEADEPLKREIVSDDENESPKTLNNMNDLKSMSTKVPEDLDILETSEMGKETEINLNEFNDLIIKEETVVMSNGLVEDIEVGREADEPLKNEIVSDEVDGSPKTLNKEMSSEKEERNEQGENEINLDKYKPIINKEIIIVLKDCLLEKNEMIVKALNNFGDGGISRKNHLKKLRTNKLNTHLSVPSDKKEYECSECGKHFSNRGNLNIHRLTHSREKPRHRKRKCSDCGQLFRHLTSLNRHRLIHSGEKPHKCSNCGRCFRHLTSLNNHRLIHSGEKPHKCSNCGKCFRRIHHLTRHRLIHLGEKPYKCSDCDKCFRRVDYLNRHRLIHSGEMPHKCSKCGQGFRCVRSLALHQRTHRT